VRTPTTPGYPAFPLVDERASEERPPWEPRTRNEMENEIARLKAMQMQLGASLGWIVDALGKDSETEDEEDEVKKLAKRKGEALESLQYIRDVLQRGITNLEDDKLWGEDELRKQKERALQIPIVEQRPATTPPTAPPPTTIFSPTPEIATQTATLPRSFSRFQLPSAAVISYPDSPSPPVAGIPTPSLLSPNAQDTQLSSWKRPTMSSFGPSSPPRVSGFAAPGSQPRSPPPVTSLPRSPQPSSGILPRLPGLPTPKIAAANMAASPATSTSSLPQTPPVPFALNLPPSAKSDKDRRQRQEVQNDPLGALH
jgi:TBC1 domain family member 5